LKILCLPSILGVNEGANISPRGQKSPLGPTSSPLGANFTPWGKLVLLKTGLTVQFVCLVGCVGGRGHLLISFGQLQTEQGAEKNAPF
jgi:hypothetical protein